MEQSLQIDCYNCRILYPGMVRCGVCKGSGVRLEPARMGDEAVSHEILKDALSHLNTQGGTILSGRSRLVHLLILWQVHGRAYVVVEKRVAPGSPQHTRELNQIRDRIVSLIRSMDRL